MIYLGADHRGFTLKKQIAEYLSSKGIQFEDKGAESLNPSDDYVMFAKKVADSVVLAPENKGILICGSGVGMNVAANKVKGIRAGMGINQDQVVSARADDDMNILVIASDVSNFDEVRVMIDAFLATSFDNQENHARRITQISELEDNNK